MNVPKLPVLAFASCFILGILSTGCSTSVGSKIVVSSANISRYDALSSSDAVAALGNRIEEARADNMPFLAPSYFREASEILEKAQKSLSNKSKDELIGEVAKADALLDKGQATMSTVKTRLAGELDQKNYLDKFNAAKSFPGKYADTVSDLSDLIKKIELEKADDIEADRLELLRDMQELVILTVQYNTLHESETINADTQDKDGEKLAPGTYAMALLVYQDALSRIAQDPHDEISVRRAGKDALFAANHAHHVTARVTLLQKQVKDSLESVVLDEEKRLLDISTSMGHWDLRDQPIEKQSEELSQVASDLLHQRQKASTSMESAIEQRDSLELRMDELKERLSGKDVEIEILNKQVEELKNAALPDSAEKVEVPDQPALSSEPAN
jgi:hypothetical protein